MQAIALGASGLVGLGVLAFFGYKQLVKAGVLRYNKWDRRERGSLKVGDRAADLPVTMYDGTPTSLSKLWQTKPVLLVFGSCT
jgi:cytochrome oxidase Cu insertion factor (SCO1/SenC/PrrC family)